MSVINILDKSVYNKIAAGEVVEKPASVVKELVENSIDAGATNINIEILNGGITQIKVSDNGKGIDIDDFDKVFLPHATSKVKTVDDLSSIGTLGFRGEALSSIASVSNVTLSSKVDSEDAGYQVKVLGGEMGEITPIGATKGTYMIIEDLFYNIPARKKFLRKPKMEENDITNYVSRLIMANPNISIKYTADNKVVYQSFGTGLYDAIYAIYGKSIVDNIEPFECNKGDYKFSGYLCKPTFSKPNRTYQTLIINGRYVVNQSISTAIYKAYENFMMKGNFPFFVLNLTIPLDKVDVNVHPNKLDVKFEDSNQIFGIVYNAVIDYLYKLNTTKTIVLEEENKEPNVDTSKLKSYSDFGTKFEGKYEDLYKNASVDEEIKEVDLSQKTDNSEYEILRNPETSEGNEKDKIIPIYTDALFDFKVKAPTNENTTNIDIIPNIISNGLSENIKNTEKLHTEFTNTANNCLDINSNNPQMEALKEVETSKTEFRVIGTLFDTYILLEKEGKLLIMDQHAGHERVLYDKFTKELENSDVAIQPLLVPYIIETNYLESGFIKDNMRVISDLGFELEEFGDNAYKVSGVPMLFANVNVHDFFDEILSDIDNKLVMTKTQTIKDYLARSACKAAVKGNDKLSDNEINALLSQISSPDQVLLCPHGRPILIEFSQKEIEKWFKRIV